MFDAADPGPDYELAWPPELLRAEATAVAGIPYDLSWTDDAELLLEEAFTSSTPRDDLKTVTVHDLPGDLMSPYGTPSSGWGPPAGHHQQVFLLHLAGEVDQLPRRTAPRPYWPSRHVAARPVLPPRAAVVQTEQVQRDWAAMVEELLNRGYLDQAAARDCVDDPRPPQGDSLNREALDRLGIDGLWPLRPGGWDEDTFYGLVEVVHDLVARPRHRRWHDYSGCGWHYSRFATAPGRALYRWRVDQVLARHGIPLRMAAAGEDAGRLIHVVGDDRELLVAQVAAVDSDRGTRGHAAALFRGRGAGVPEKRSAILALLGLLELRRDLVKTELLSKDEGALFSIANQFALRHQRADQRADYDEAYLDWLYWWYLATLNLTDRLLDRQADGAGAGAP